MFYVDAHTEDNQMDIKYFPLAYSTGVSVGTDKFYVRPLVTIKASLFNNEGDGTKDNPWKLEKK